MKQTLEITGDLKLIIEDRELTIEQFQDDKIVKIKLSYDEVKHLNTWLTNNF